MGLEEEEEAADPLVHVGVQPGVCWFDGEGKCGVKVRVSVSVCVMPADPSPTKAHCAPRRSIHPSRMYAHTHSPLAADRSANCSLFFPSFFMLLEGQAEEERGAEEAQPGWSC